MKSFVYIAMGSVILASGCTGGAGRIDYPETIKYTTVVDDYFGTKEADPYRWLENDTSAVTGAWGKTENSVMTAHL